MKISIEKIKFFLSIVLIAFMFMFFFIVQYGEIPTGDDILFQFKDSFCWYTQRDVWHPTQFIDNFPLMVEEIFNRWKLFSGRLTTAFFVPLLNILGQKICSFIGALIYTLVILCIAVLTFEKDGNWIDFFQHPFELVIIFLFQYALTPTALYMHQWTFVCHYAMSTLLYLLYIIYTKRNYTRNNCLKTIICQTILGLFTGATHELLGGYCIMIIFFEWLQLYIKRKVSIKDLYIHTGLIVGYAFTLLAPGNFIRLKIEHDNSRITTGILEKFRYSIGAHVYALGIGDLVPTLIILVSIILFIFSFCCERRNIKEFVFDNSGVMLSVLLSVLMWAVVAPPVPQYGLQIWKALFIIFIYRNIHIRHINQYIYSAVTVILISICILQSWKWQSELIEIGNLRRVQIANGIANGDEIVYISPYPDITSNYTTRFNRANENDFSGEFGKLFYGIEVYPEGYVIE